MNIENAIKIALDFTKKWEQLASKTKGKTSYFSNPNNVSSETIIYSYPDADKRSIGWGTYGQLSNGTPVTSDLTITKEQADYELDAEMRKTEKEIRQQINVDNLTPSQYAAILDYGYNAGSYALNRNGLLDAINNNGDVETALKGASITIKGSGGQVSSNLQNRRKDEAQLWGGNYNETYSLYLRNATTINYVIIGFVLLGLFGAYKYARYKKII